MFEKQLDDISGFISCFEQADGWRRFQEKLSSLEQCMLLSRSDQGDLSAVVTLFKQCIDTGDVDAVADMMLAAIPEYRVYIELKLIDCLMQDPSDERLMQALLSYYRQGGQQVHVNQRLYGLAAALMAVGGSDVAYNHVALSLLMFVEQPIVPRMQTQIQSLLDEVVSNNPDDTTVQLLVAIVRSEVVFVEAASHSDGIADQVGVTLFAKPAIQPDRPLPELQVGCSHRQAKWH